MIIFPSPLNFYISCLKIQARSGKFSSKLINGYKTLDKPEVKVKVGTSYLLIALYLTVLQFNP